MTLEKRESKVANFSVSNLVASRMSRNGLPVILLLNTQTRMLPPVQQKNNSPRAAAEHVDVVLENFAGAVVADTKDFPRVHTDTIRGTVDALNVIVGEARHPGIFR